MDYQTESPSAKRIRGQIQAERIIIKDQLAKQRSKYPALEKEAEYAVNRQMRVYYKIKELEDQLVKLDVMERELG